jgi:hypothetical protein
MEVFDIQNSASLCKKYYNIGLEEKRQMSFYILGGGRQTWL